MKDTQPERQMSSTEGKSHSNNRRIAKNTLALYFRMLFSMVVSLFTSRVILDVLGVDNYGINNVVGGLVSMFSLMSSALTNSISRFLTFELGAGDTEKLKRVFSTSLNVMFVLSAVVVIVGETAGLWFLNTEMNIPADRMGAANLVYQLSIVTFIFGLISVPYNASILSHEKMEAFAYIGIFQVVARLVIVYFIYISPFDKLKTYAVLLFLLSVVTRLIYGVYCHRHFEETNYRFVYDKSLLRQMTGFAGWNFFAQAAFLMNNSGTNLLINMFFGVAVNAARGIAGQVNGAVLQFLSFTMALNPQITKCYAAGEYDAMHKLIYRGAKFSFFLVLVFLIPICMETDFILHIWLKDVPDCTVQFVRWSLFISAIDTLSGTLITGLHASGRIKRYMIVVGLVEMTSFPITWLAFCIGAVPVYSYYIYFAVYTVLMFLRLYLIKDLIRMSAKVFIREVYCRVGIVAAVSPILPFIVFFCLPEGIVRFLAVGVTSVLCTGGAIYCLGFTVEERKMLRHFVADSLNKFLKR